MITLDRLNRPLVEHAAEHLDTAAERLYEHALLVHVPTKRSRYLERRARLLRLARELRDVVSDGGSREHS